MMVVGRPKRTMNDNEGSILIGVSNLHFPFPRLFFPDFGTKITMFMWGTTLLMGTILSFVVGLDWPRRLSWQKLLVNVIEKGFLVILLLVQLRPWLGVAGNAEGDALAAFMDTVEDPQVLGSWDRDLDNPCTWFQVHCNSNHSVTGIKLGALSLSGKLVSEFGQLPNLQYLELYSNKLTGEIPDALGYLTKLVTLDLNSNNLTGPIPNSFANLKLLTNLRLNNNSLSGSIPMYLTNIRALQVLDLSYNKLTGTIPINGSFSNFTDLSFQGNNLVNTPRPPPPPPAPALSPPSARRRTIITVAAFAAAAVLLFVGPAIVIAFCRRRRERIRFFNIPGEDEPEVHYGQLKKFSLRELQVATGYFNPKNILGQGGFGKVYKGRLVDGSLVAVKRLNEERSQGGELQFQAELEIISLAVHQNLLKLRGFCMTVTERLLVYPYMPNGSVASRLRATEGQDSRPPLEWPIRKGIALGVAKGLTYLHEHCNPKIIHRDMKAANILLDEDFEAVVGDFGLAKLMDYKDTHVTTAVCGTIGHIAPEYLSTGAASDKTDVFGYGIMLLEVITGQRAFDLARLANDQDIMLLDWVKGLLKERRLEVLVDSNIRGHYIEEEVEQLIQIALLCTQVNAAKRPKMSTVVGMLEGEGLGETWEQWQKDEMLQASSPTTPKNILLSYPDSASLLLEIELSGPR